MVRFNSKYFNRLPEWALKPQAVNMTMTHDFDSIFTSAIYKRAVPESHITEFYNFRERYRSGSYDKNKETIVFDASMAHEKCISNHPTYLFDEQGNLYKNPDDLNLNNIILRVGSQNYDQKARISSSLLAMSLWGYMFHLLSDEAILVASCIDRGHEPFYDARYPDAKRKHIEHMVNILGLPEVIRCQEKYTLEECEYLIQKYKLGGRVYMNNGRLETEIDLEGLSKLFRPWGLSFVLPWGKFELLETYNTKSYGFKQTPPAEQIVSSARVKAHQIFVSTYKNTIQRIVL